MNQLIRLTTMKKPAVSIVAQLRRLTPQRPLSFSEAQRLAEMQATRLRHLLNQPTGRFGEQLIAGLPRLDVQYRPGLVGSGITTWERGAWRIAVNADEPTVRQRFTLAHELKHVIDASHEDTIYRELPPGPGRERHIEAVCDHFAACLLMPRASVERLWQQGVREPSLLAWHFDVSQQAILIRLHNLGFTKSVPRCLPSIGRIAISGARPGRHGAARTAGAQPIRTRQYRRLMTRPLRRASSLAVV